MLSIAPHFFIIADMITELEQRDFEFNVENSDVIMFDYSKEKTTGYFFILFFDRNDFIEKSEFFSDRLRINIL